MNNYVPAYVLNNIALNFEYGALPITIHGATWRSTDFDVRLWTLYRDNISSYFLVWYDVPSM